MTSNQVAMRGQAGFVLISSLIILILLTLMGAAMVNLGTINLRVINNTQRQMEARSVAQRVVDGIISTNFVASAATLDAVMTANPYSVALADSGYKTYSVTITERPCMQQFKQFVLDDPRVQIPTGGTECVGLYCKCVQGAESFCADTLWRIQAEVSEGWFGANENLAQGVSLVVDVENALYQRGLEYETNKTSAEPNNPYCH